jgi:DNA-directed RNA polymerase specialized sigma24 family protein
VADEELDVQDAVGSLPRAHLLALRAALVGFDDAQLAALVGVPPESVRPLLRVATAKLGRALAGQAEPD